MTYFELRQCAFFCYAEEEVLEKGKKAAISSFCQEIGENEKYIINLIINNN